MVTKNIAAGKTGEVLLDRKHAGKDRFFRLPGILIRYELRLITRDSREIRLLFDPDREKSAAFPVQERGAYYGPMDRLFIGDILGLFRLYLPIPQDKEPRLLALPGAAAEPIQVYIQSGGDSRRQTPRYQRTDNLIDHRPYTPGDDPRRINWKLYGHAPSNELFVREGEPEPPPHSRLLILVDTLADPALYSPASGRRGVDILCENALAIALEYAHRNMEISIGYSGSTLTEGAETELAEALAYPAAYPAPGFGNTGGGSLQADLPLPPPDRGVLILALPRTEMGTSALDRVLKNPLRGQRSPTDLFFLYAGDGLEESAETCVRIYGQNGGVHARQIRL
jgi:hypothetical protein